MLFYDVFRQKETFSSPHLGANTLLTMLWGRDAAFTDDINPVNTLFVPRSKHDIYKANLATNTLERTQGGGREREMQLPLDKLIVLSRLTVGMLGSQTRRGR